MGYLVGGCRRGAGAWVEAHGPGLSGCLGGMEPLWSSWALSPVSSVWMHRERRLVWGGPSAL